MAGKLTGYHILLVEDDISSQILIEKVLTYHGASVVAMGSGEKAIDYLKDGNVVDVVILDLKLPRMDGYTVFNAIKEMLPAVPIFAQTAYIYGNESENVLALGFDSYFSKPIDFDRLMDTILITKSSHSAK